MKKERTAVKNGEMVRRTPTLEANEYMRATF